jgi:hypothetical protein
MVARIEIGKRQAVIKKCYLDLSLFQRTRDALVVFRRQENPAWLMDGAMSPAGWSSSAPAERRSASSCGFDKASEQSLN